MKKWLKDIPPPSSSSPPDIPPPNLPTNSADTNTLLDDTYSVHTSTPNHGSEVNGFKFSKSDSARSKMGLGVSSETSQSQDSDRKDQNASTVTNSHNHQVPVSMCNPSSVAFITSVSSKTEGSSAHSSTNLNSDVCVHSSKPVCSSWVRSKDPLHSNSIAPFRVTPASEQSESNSFPQNDVDFNPSSPQAQSSGSHLNAIQEVSQPSSSSRHLVNTQGLTVSVPSLFKSADRVYPIPYVSDNCSISNSSQLASSSSNNILDVEASSECQSRPESANETWCAVGLHTAHTHPQNNYGSTSLSTSESLNLHSSSRLVHITPSVSGSSGCGHWCSACRVRVQVEVECVSGSQRSPSGNRRGIRTLSFPKRVRHKVKAQTKDLNGTHKKKKSPWSFRLSCRMRPNKSDSEQDHGSSSALNVGCVSCVCPGYRHSDTEPVYRSVIDNCNTANNVSSNSLHSPIVNLSQFNSDTFSIHNFENLSSRTEQTRERSEDVDGPSAFIPLLRENSSSLALPLTYNSMIDLQVLLESSLRLGLGGPRTSGMNYPGESFMRHVATDNSFFSRTVHTQVDYIHCLVPDLLTISKCGFYWGKMDRYEAERLLDNKPEGTFLLRDSAQEEFLFSVSFRRYGRSLHARIEQWNHKFSFDSHDPTVFACSTVCGLIEHYKDPSCCMYFEPLLTNPLARNFPFTLQHLCRATICSKTTYDGINNLELPKSLKNYLKEYHYKQRVRVRHLD